MLCVFCFPFHVIVWGDWLMVCVMLLCELCKKPAHRGHLIQWNLCHFEPLEISNYLFCLAGVVGGEGWSRAGMIHFLLYFEERQVTQVNMWVMGFMDWFGRNAVSICQGNHSSLVPISHASHEHNAGWKVWSQPWPYGSTELYSSFRVFRNHCAHSVT